MAKGLFDSTWLLQAIIYPVTDYIKVRRTIGWLKNQSAPRLNRNDDDENFCLGKSDADDETRTLWVTFSEGPTSQQSGYQEDRKERTEGPNSLPTWRHRVKLRRSRSWVPYKALCLACYTLLKAALLSTPKWEVSIT